MGEICVLLMFLELVEVFVDEDRIDEGKEGRKKAVIYAQELPCALPPLPTCMCSNPWSRRPSGVLTFP